MKPVKIVHNSLTELICSIFKWDAFVLSKGKIFLQSSTNQRQYQDHIEKIMNREESWGFHGAPDDLFRHELSHIIQCYKYGFITRTVDVVMDIFKSHNEKQLELEADVMAMIMQGMKPVEVSNYWFTRGVMKMED